LALEFGSEVCPNLSKLHLAELASAEQNIIVIVSE
jgi:hypothetical protein